ncbi:MAG: hypothetical protein CMD29_02555 [Flavobacteriales bacterium]|jgi:glycosyltransferase domain-containing protein|nr:hypothetical protein [Flavobacteriales bacterium]|tara:strand:- start:837 stop:1946 length:1110 start_codon:yes stop_codon:yes gene_type:complete
MVDSVNQILKKLTIVIPSYNRQNYILRQIKFWKNKLVKVIILDGSLNPLDIFKNEIPPNIYYIHDNSTIENRLKIAESMIKTSYSVLLSDDEFFIPSVLENCVLELEKNKEYSVCKGTAIAFDFLFNKVNGYPIYTKLENYIVDQSKKEDRLNFHLGNYAMAVLWGVTRTNVFLKMLRAISKGPYASAAVAEMTCSIIGAWEGKIKVINELMWLRSFENDAIWWSFGNLQFHYWSEMPQFRNEFKRFISSIVNEIKSENENHKEVHDNIILGVKEYTRHCNSLKSVNPKKFPKPSNSFIIKFYGSTIVKIRVINKKMKFLIKRIIILLTGKDYWYKPIEELLNQIKNKNIKVSFKEVEKCIALINEHHK